MIDYLTVREASSPEELDRSLTWIWAGIRLGKIKAEKKGNLSLIHNSEIKRVKEEGLIITRKDLLG